MTPVRVLQAALAAAAAGAAAGSALPAGGASVECRLEGAVRHIEVVRDPAPARSCEMRYGEPGNGQPLRVVWYSERDRTFCHERADNLIATLARRGWVCDVMRRRNVAGDSDREVRAGSVLTVPRPQ